jgi:hypothetical protein
MIVLLPLRGWAGDLMSVQMATSGLAAGVAGAVPPHCPMHAQTGAAQATTPVAAATGNVTCCDLCVPMAELSSGRLEALSFAAHAKPLTGGVEFRSASPARAVEPPIS